MNIKKCEKNFNYLKNLLNDNFMIKEEIDGFYYPALAIETVNKSQVNYFINNYYNLKTCDILNMIDEAENIIQVKENLFCAYKVEYASAWYNNFLEVLEKIKITKPQKNMR